MPTLRLIFQTTSPVPKKASAFPILKSANVADAYFPGRGLPLSLLVHVLLFCVFFFFRSSQVDLRQTKPPQRATIIDREESRVVMYLPLLADGSLGIKLPAGEAKTRSKATPAAAPARRPKGLSYPGLQEILSDPPNPTNLIQTVQQPALENPPVLTPPIALPNIVQLADAGPSLPPVTPEPVRTEEPPPAVPRPEPIKPADQPPQQPQNTKPVEPPPIRPPEMPKPPVAEPESAVSDLVLPPIKAAPPELTDVPKLILPPLPKPPQEPEPKKEIPEPAHANMPIQPTVPPKENKAPEVASTPIVLPKTETKKAEAPKAESPKAETSAKKVEKPAAKAAAPNPSSSGSGSGRQDLLTLTPMPAPVQQPLRVPPGEARGRFAISPKPNLSATETQPGSKNGVSPDEAGIEGRAETTTAKALPQGTNEKDEPKSEASGGSGPSPKDVPTAKAGGGSNTSGKITAGSAEQGKGSGASPGIGEGKGSGAATKKPFAGITIVGGSYEPGTEEDVAPVVQARRPLQTAYGLTIISTENSGGGLPYYGVFSQEQVYTVYLDMRRDESDTAPSWTLEFALIQDGADPADASGNPGRSREGLILPFPIEKDQPPLPIELVRKYQGRMIVVYAVINTEGKMEQMAVKDSPDPLMDEPLLRSFAKWLFRPAQRNGSPVSVKALIGIPLRLPEL